MPSILIVDDHEVVRRGLKQVLAEGLPAARFGEAGLSEAAEAELARQEWDLLLLDVNLPGRGGLELLEDVRRIDPRLPVLVVSAYAEEEFAVRCIRLGAAGYVTKNSASDELVAAARKVLDGGKYVTATLAERLAGVLGGEVGGKPEDALSARELQNPPAGGPRSHHPGDRCRAPPQREDHRHLPGPHRRKARDLDAGGAHAVRAPARARRLTARRAVG